MNSFEKLCRRSCGFSLPFLFHLYDNSNTVNLYYVNKTDTDIVYGGHTFKKAVCTYTPNTSSYGFDGGGKFEITSIDEIIEFIESYNDMHLEVVACMNEQGTFTELKNYNHHYGSMTVDRRTVSFSFEKDDRLDMTFPTLIWSTQNNKGNS